jgi:hypothetical protein
MGLVSRWKLDERSGAMTADSGGTGNAGTISGAAWEMAGFPAAKYPNPGCLRFDGVNDFVELGTEDLPANDEPQTVSLWFNRGTGAPAGNNVVLSLTEGAEGGSRLKIGVRMGRVSAWKSGTPGELAVGPTAPTGWHHLAYTYDGTTHRLFVDGNMMGMSTNAPDDGPVVRGRLGGNFDGSERFAGQIDEVRIYNRALTPAEVSSLAAGLE